MLGEETHRWQRPAQAHLQSKGRALSLGRGVAANKCSIEPTCNGDEDEGEGENEEDDGTQGTPLRSILKRPAAQRNPQPEKRVRFAEKSADPSTQHGAEKSVPVARCDERRGQSTRATWSDVDNLCALESADDDDDTDPGDTDEYQSECDECFAMPAPPVGMFEFHHSLWKSRSQ